MNWLFEWFAWSLGFKCSVHSDPGEGFGYLICFHKFWGFIFEDTFHGKMLFGFDFEQFPSKVKGSCILVMKPLGQTKQANEACFSFMFPSDPQVASGCCIKQLRIPSQMWKLSLIRKSKNRLTLHKRLFSSFTRIFKMCVLLWFVGHSSINMCASYI